MASLTHDIEPIKLRPPRNRVSPRARYWWTLRALVLVLSLAGGLTLGFLLLPATRPVVGPALIATLLLGTGYVVIMPRWRYLIHRWETTDQAVYAASGWLVREWRVAPISRIQTVDTVRGPLQQLLGLATLTVTTASSSGAIYLTGMDKLAAADAAAWLTEITQATPGDAT